MAESATLLPPPEAWRAEFRDLALDVVRGQIAVGGLCRRLTPQQQVILGVLLVRPWASLEMLMDALWGSWIEPPEHPLIVIRVQICQLRRKLEGSGAMILTVFAQGYLLQRVANDNQPPSEAAA